MPEIKHNKLARLHDYWLSRKIENRRWPRLVDIDPVEIRYCLGFVALADIEEPFRVRYRLVGTKLDALYGADLTGRYIDQLYTPLFRKRVLAVYQKVVDSGEPLYDAPYFGFFRFKLGYHRLLLPLSTTGERVDVVMAGIYPTDTEIETAADWRSVREVREWLVEEEMSPFLWGRKANDG